MKNELAKMLTFENLVNMGFEAPSSKLVDFSDDTYNQAASRCEIRRNHENRVDAFFIDGKMSKVRFDFAGPDWYMQDDVEDWAEVEKLF